MSSERTPEKIRLEFLQRLDSADTAIKIEEERIHWLGRSGQITQLLKQLGSLPIEQKKLFGPQYNGLRDEMAVALKKKETQLRTVELTRELEHDTLDTSLPGTPLSFGHLHPLSQVAESLVSIFRSLGFVCADGPEMETEFYNFEALNVPADHPARDMQDTFYIAPSKEVGVQQFLFSEPGAQAAGQSLLRTHTSPVQVHVMQTYRPPIAVVCPGRVYRHEAVDATHAAVFHQIEGLLVDEGVSFADLKGTLARFAQLFFAPTTKTRFRPSFFPFTEPSAQMDVSCMSCHGSGCAICKHTGWIELLGAGMVNPIVFKHVNIDAEKYSGFAFGMGVERLALIKYGVDDLRVFFENDLRFLEQF